MLSKWFRILTILVIFSFIGSMANITLPVNAATDAQSGSDPHVTIGAPQNGSMRVISPSAMGKLASLASVEPHQPTRAEIERAARLHELTNRQIPRPAGEGKSSDSSIIQNGQNAPVGAGMPSPIANFDGVNNVNGVLPPDTEGDIGWNPLTGTKYYIQWVNLSFQIWDVTNPAAPVSLYGPAAGNTLFSSLGGICASHNDGDPIVLFDQLANRWLMSQFALAFPNDFHQCIAISASADPLGSWYLYDFQTSTVNMNDYPKFGVWPDGYYMSVNQFNGTSFAWAGAGVAVFERSQMLTGGPAQMIYIDTGTVTLNYGGMLPSDLDGLTAPPPGTPNYFMEWDDSSWLGDPQDSLRIWEFDVDWVTPANTTFGLNTNYDPNYIIPTTNVAPLCIGTRDCVPQPGTTAKLDAIADRLMYRLAYRNFGTYQSLVTNHTVDVDPGAANQAGIHWFELRNTGSGWSMYQEGVYSGDVTNTENRWMGSIAMDNDGNMALGYSVASSTVYPSIYYTGRLGTDPLNTLPQGETLLIAGGGSQTHTSARWGDYSMMSVDPQDDCTFWYTQEYYATTSTANWRTRIGSFVFPSCTAASTGTLQGTVTDSSSNPIAGATISITGGYTTTTNASGQYSILLPPGTYDVTASKYGYLPSTANNVVINASSTTTQDFTLATAPSYTVTLQAYDATTGWPLYASVTIPGYSGGPVFTNPVTGQTSITLFQGSYLFTFHAMSGGYTDVSQSVNVNANMTITANLLADASCTAPGYQAATIFSEGFEGSFLPAGWSKYQVTGTTGFNQGTTGSTGSHGSAHNGNYYAWHNDDSGTQDSWLVTPQLSIPAGAPGFTFWQRGYFTSWYTFHEVAITTNANPDPSVATYTQLYTGNLAAENIWEFQAIDLSAYAGQNVYIAFHYQGDYSDEWYLDDVAVAGCSPIAGAGLVVGGVFDANTNTRLAGASVQSGSTNAVIVNASADPAIGGELYIIGLPSGTQSITASRPPYGSVTHSVTVTAGNTVQQDFYLPIAQLSITPTSMSFTVPLGGTDSAPATLSNIGGLSASYEIFAIDGPVPSMPVTGPFDAATRHTGPKSLNNYTSKQLRIRPEPDPGVTPLAAGDVVTSWTTGLTYAWGIGFNTDANDLWLTNIAVAGGDDKAYRFTTTGTNTGDTINLAGMGGGVFAADMTYNPFTNKLWVVNVGGDNCIYELDPASLIQTGNKICPAFGTSQRGLAYDPVTDTFFSGSWNDFKINRFKPDGTLLSSVNVNLEISGLAYNPVTKHLFVLSNTDAGIAGIYDVMVLDASTPGVYPVVGGFRIMNGSTPVFSGANAYGQAGMEIDCSGNLWLVNQVTSTVYVAQSGETNVCNWQSTWLSASPTSGTLSAGNNTTITVSVNAGTKPAGTYQGHLRIASPNTLGPISLPVTMTVVDAAPTVVSILRYTPASQLVTSGNSVTYRVTFSEDVTGVDAADFALTLLSVPGVNASISSVTQVNPTVYDVTVDITALRNSKNKWDGAIRLDIPSTATIQDTAANPLGGLPYTSGQVYSIVQEQTFTDVSSSHWAWSYIERLFYMGITGGCGTNTFCPDNIVTRAEMAVLLERGMHGYTFTPPNVSPTFGDTAGHWAEDWIEALKNDGITTGCGGGNFCPDSPITRAEMAVFLLRAKYGASYTPPNLSPTFGDTVGHWAEDWIEQLAIEGITTGCGGGNFCPDSPITRAEMAVFIIKTFNLP